MSGIKFVGYSCPDRSFQFFTRHSSMNPYSFLIASMKRHSSLNPNCDAMEIKIKSNRLILLWFKELSEERFNPFCSHNKSHVSVDLFFIFKRSSWWNTW
ncbi:hypothetical protein HanPI659440_Chr09g0359991 [Helianthus annuus]|nr:hypothetical protein HanPI659440_Chr09g0359991 [Helianthus annuus]